MHPTKGRAPSIDDFPESLQIKVDMLLFSERAYFFFRWHRRES